MAWFTLQLQRIKIYENNNLLLYLTTKNFNSEQFLNCPRRPIPHDLALALLSCFLSLSTCLWMIMMWRLNKLSSHWKLTINAWVHRWGTTNSGWCSGKSWLEAAAATWVCVRRSPSPAQWNAAKNVNKKYGKQIGFKNQNLFTIFFFLHILLHINVPGKDIAEQTQVEAVATNWSMFFLLLYFCCKIFYFSQLHNMIHFI